MLNKYIIQACMLFMEDKLEVPKRYYWIIKSIGETSTDKGRYYSLILNIRELEMISKFHNLKDDSIIVDKNIQIGGGVKVYLNKNLVDTIEHKLSKKYLNSRIEIEKNIKEYITEYCPDENCPRYKKPLTNGKCISKGHD